MCGAFSLSLWSWLLISKRLLGSQHLCSWNSSLRTHQGERQKTAQASGPSQVGVLVELQTPGSSLVQPQVLRLSGELWVKDLWLSFSPGHSTFQLNKNKSLKTETFYGNCPWVITTVFHIANDYPSPDSLSKRNKMKFDRIQEYSRSLLVLSNETPPPARILKNCPPARKQWTPASPAERW